MKWCQPHWQQLRAAIEQRGLTKFGPQTAEALHADMVAELEGESTAFDPLMGSLWRITSKVTEHVGLRIMGNCPLCILVEDGRPELVADWIDGVTDSALVYAIEQKLVLPQ